MPDFIAKKKLFVCEKAKSNRTEVYAEPIEIYAEPVEAKSNRAEAKSNRAETKSNRAEVKSNRAGTGLPLAMRFCAYAKKINLQGNILVIFRARFARFARFTEFLT